LYFSPFCCNIMGESVVIHMQFEGSVVKEQGVTFGIVVVKSYVLSNEGDKRQMTNLGIRAFGMMPIILMAQDSRGIPTYFGRKDIVGFLSHINPARIPWKRYTID
jgi:hypothetical protein